MKNAKYTQNSRLQSVQVGVDKGRLRIQFSRRISKMLFGKSQKYLYLELSDTPENWIIAERIALQIDNDIRAKKLEKDLRRYLPCFQLQQAVGIFYDPDSIQISTLDIFDKFSSFKKGQVQPETFYVHYEVRRHSIEEVCQDLNNQELIVDNLYKSCKGRKFTETCRILHHALEWGKKRDLIPANAPNKFLSLMKDYNVSFGRYKPSNIIVSALPHYIHDRDYRAFDCHDSQMIIQSFDELADTKTYWKHGVLYHFTPRFLHVRDSICSFIKLKFWTGCRNGEASALRWQDIDENFNYIYFCKSFSSRDKVLKCLKTEGMEGEGEHARKFPCGPKLKVLLQDLREKSPAAKPDDFLFTNANSKPIVQSTINHYWYGSEDKRRINPATGDHLVSVGVVSQLIIDGKISQYLTAYATRHTWITRQLVAGVHITNVAKLAGNSPQTILKNYSSFVPNLDLAPEV